MSKQTTLLLLISLIAITFSCKENRHLNGNIDTSIVISMERFDQDFNSLKSKDTKTGAQELATKYAEFFTIYNQGVIKIGDASDPYYNNYVQRFLNDSIYSMVYDTVQHYFPSLEIEEEKLTSAFRNYNLIFPDKEIPQCYTHISGFNEPIVVGNGLLSISLENYLGEEHVFYKNLGTYSYLLPRKKRENIAADVMRGWLMSEFPNNKAHTKLLDNIIQEGKLLYIQGIIMPKESPERIIGLTKANYQWCEDNEVAIWRFMIEQKHLFSTQQVTITKYMKDGPFFNYFGSGSSPLVGKYIGWQIVKNYMENHPKTTIEQLLEMPDSQEILQDSFYKP